MVGGGGGEVLLRVLDPRQTEPSWLGKPVIEEILGRSGETPRHVREVGATVGNVLRTKLGY